MAEPIEVSMRLPDRSGAFVSTIIGSDLAEDAPAFAAFLRHALEDLGLVFAEPSVSLKDNSATSGPMTDLDRVEQRAEDFKAAADTWARQAMTYQDERNAERARADRAEKERDEAREYLTEATDGWNEATERLARAEAALRKIADARIGGASYVASGYFATIPQASEP